jgi:hypothetical protein
MSEQLQNDAIQSNRELAWLKGKISQSELYARGRIISRLDNMISKPDETFGKVKNAINSVGVKNAIENLKEVRDALQNSNNVTIGSLWDKEINAYFKGWDAPGDTNVAVLSGTKMTYRKFLSNVINDSALVASLFSKEQTSNSPSWEDAKKISRLGTFLVALESKYPDAEYKTMFRQTHEALANNRLDNATEIVRAKLKSEWNIDLSSVIGDGTGYANALRAIGDTTAAAKAAIKETISEGNLPKNKILEQSIASDYWKQLKENTSLATQQYQLILEAIPVSDPYRKQIERSKDAMIKEIASEKAYMNIVDAHIKQYGSTDPGSMLKMYDDMKWLHGIFNFSDENAQMTKEMAIMLASFVLTAGVWPMLSSIAMAARAGQAAMVTKNITQWATLVSRAKSIASTASSASLGWVARVAEVGASADKIATANKFVRIPTEALKFTTADALIRNVTRNEGDRSGFYDFANKLAINTVMFGAFAGMEKFISGPTRDLLINNFNVSNTAAKFALGTTVLTAWDIAVMQWLHAAETGRLEWDWMSVYQALVFRVGMKWTEKLFPKLSAKYEALKNKGETKTPKSEPLVQNLDTRETAHGASLEPIGTNVAKAENGGKIPEIKSPVGKNKIVETPELTNKPTKLEWADIKEKPPYRNESRLAKLHQGRSDSETLLQKLQAEYARLRDAFHIPSDKQLKFDYFHTSETNWNRINSQMRVVKVGEDMFVQVKNNGVWEVATEQNIIPKSPNARAEYDAYVQHQKDLLRSWVHNQIPDDVISMNDSWDLFKKQLNFDFYNNRSNTKMRVVELPNNDYLVQVKNNGVWEVATEQNIIPKSPNARAEYDAYVQHQKDLLRSWVHNQFMKPEELNKQILDATHRLQRIDSLIQKESTRPGRPIQNNDTLLAESRPNTDIWQQSTLSHSDTIDPYAKARIESEHGLDGSRKRYTEADLINEWNTIIPGAGADIPAAVAAWPNGVKNFIEKYKRYLPWLLLIPLVLLAIRSCDKSPADKKTMEDICKECLNGPKSEIDNHRKINGNTADTKYREGVSQRWIQSPDWKKFIKNYTDNKVVLSNLSTPNQKSVVQALDAVLTKWGATVINVQTLQHCIGMFEEQSSGWKDPIKTLDHQGAQDGMLGPITTKKLNAFISTCIVAPVKQKDIPVDPVLPNDPITDLSGGTSII